MEGKNLRLETAKNTGGTCVIAAVSSWTEYTIVALASTYSSLPPPVSVISTGARSA
jgi:hypothetical protein